MQKNISDIRHKLTKHPIYAAIESIRDLQIFMESHVFAVWDFMFLLKSLQKSLTCTEEFWVPTGDAQIRRLINEIVLAEESDEIDGKVESHFEFYVSAMKEIGCETTYIHSLIEKAKKTKAFDTLLLGTKDQPAVNAFLNSTTSLIKKGNIHEIASSFTFGRESVIPDMFVEIVGNLNTRFPGKVDRLLKYLERHIELDGDEHGPLAYKMLELLCGLDQNKWDDVQVIAISATNARIQLWDGIYNQITETKASLVR
ncbi:MAG: hypothetical protein ACI9BD_001142 [Candidatus Marinamargulisbacteria bacterium]